VPNLGDSALRGRDAAGRLVIVATGGGRLAVARSGAPGTNSREQSMVETLRSAMTPVAARDGAGDVDPRPWRRRFLSANAERARAHDAGVGADNDGAAPSPPRTGALPAPPAPRPR
jgi:hypothetical protein